MIAMTNQTLQPTLQRQRQRPRPRQWDQSTINQGAVCVWRRIPPPHPPRGSESNRIRWHFFPRLFLFVQAERRETGGRGGGGVYLVVYPSFAFFFPPSGPKSGSAGYEASVIDRPRGESEGRRVCYESLKERLINAICVHLRGTSGNACVYRTKEGQEMWYRKCWTLNVYL